LHWIDDETQGFLDVLSESVASAELLLLTNYRPEYRHEWGQKTYYTQLRLAPLGRAEAEELLTFLLGNDPSLTSVKALILEKTQGTPFFMEEVVQTLVEDGTLTGAPGQYQLTQHGSTQHELTLHLPSTVQAILAARIDRLAPDEKALLQQLSVIGREFPLGLIHQVITQPEADLYRLLASLQRKEFLYEQPAFPEVEYIFGSSGNSVGKFRGLIGRKAAPVLGFRHFVGGWDLAGCFHGYRSEAKAASGRIPIYRLSAARTSPRGLR
jgi:predicted ATPase